VLPPERLPRMWEAAQPGTQGKKTIAAGRAPVGRKMEQAPRPEKPTFPHVFATDALQVEIAATRTAGIANVRRGHPPAVEAPLTGAATPRPHPPQANHKVANAVPPRALAPLAPANRADQSPSIPSMDFGGSICQKKAHRKQELLALGAVGHGRGQSGRQACRIRAR
jgi:hypothetical protein